jgi:hypothetical protein
LNPAGGGQIWTGTLGLAPNRKFVASWVGVPHAITVGGETRFTFQVILHETGEISFQYLDVQNGRSTLNSGRSATIGIEDSFGQIANQYAFHGAPSLVINGQAIVIGPQGGTLAGPSLSLNGVTNNLISLSTFAQPGHRCVLSASPDAQAWTAIETNTIPASGSLQTSRPVNGTFRFYRARLDP